MRRDPVAIFVGELREYVPDARLRFTSGGCFGLYLMIRAFRPDARPWYDPHAGHVYTEVGGRYYDIRGRVCRPPVAVPLAHHKPRLGRAWRWRYESAGDRLIRERLLREALGSEEAKATKGEEGG